MTHVAKGKGIPPFLILYVADHPDTSAQARRLAKALKESEIPVIAFGAKETNHSKLNENLGTPNDPATLAISAIVLLAMALAAAYIPAMRASRLDPIQALRHE